MNPELPTPEGAPPAPPVPPPSSNAPSSGTALPGTSVTALVQAFRARQRRTLWTEAVLWAGCALVVPWVLAGFAGTSLPWLAVALLVLSLLGAGAAVYLLGARRVSREVGDEPRTARFIGGLSKDLGEDALSAVELHRALGDDQHFSAELAHAFLNDVDRRAERLRADDLVDGRPAKRAAYALLGALFVASVAVLGWPKQWWSGIEHALGLDAQPAFAQQYEPITGDIELTYKYPAYTGLSPRTVAGSADDISAPAGTQVTLRTRSDRQVRKAEVVVNGEALPLQVEGERNLSGSFVLQKPGAYHFQFLNALGRPSARGPDLPLNVEADAAPKVDIQLPKQDLEIDPGEQVALRYEAADDYGLTGLELVFRTPGGKEQRQKLSREDGRITRGTHKWDLSALKLKAGDRVAYHVEATDNDAVTGPKKGVSRTQVVRIYSAQEHRREALQKAEALWDRLVVQLGDRLEGGDLDQPLQAAKVQANQRVDDAGSALVTELLSTASELAKGRDAPEELVAALANIAETYGRTLRNTRDLRRIFLRYSNRFDLAGDFGRRLNGAASEEVEELEKDILYLEALIDRRKLEELKALADELKDEQRNLTSLVEEYQKTQDPEVRQQVMDQIQQLRQRIAELNQKMQDLRQSIHDEHLNAEALKEMMEQKDVNSMLDEIEKLMREGKADEAMKKLQELSMQLDEMQQSLDQAQDDFGEEQNPELVQKFSDFMKDLKDTAEQQEQVANDTKELRDRYRQKMKERLQQKGEALKDQLMKKIEDASRDYAQMDPDRMDYNADRNLEDVQKELENARNALRVEDYDLAAEAAARAENAAQQLSDFGEQQKQLDVAYGNPPEVRQESDKLSQNLKKNEQRVREVNQSLQQLFPPAGQMMSQQDQQQLKELAQQQQQLQKKAEGLQQQMDEIGQMAPVFDQDAQQQMEQVGQRMEGATQKMQARDPGRGYGDQRAALDQLQQFEQQMKQSMQKQGGGKGMPLPMMSSRRGSGGSSNANEDVEIPDAEQYQAPREFRKDLLDAMKQGAPEKYKDQVKRYYEELVR